MNKKKQEASLDISNENIAMVMDEIIKRSILFYCGKTNDKPTPYGISSFLNKKNKKITIIHVQLALSLLEKDNYIITYPFEHEKDSIDFFEHTEKGLSVFIEGGFLKQVKKKKLDYQLVLVGQIGIGIAGAYYLVELLKNLCP